MSYSFLFLTDIFIAITLFFLVKHTHTSTQDIIFSMYHLLVLSTLTQFFHIFDFSYMEINIRDKLQLSYLPIPVSISLSAYLEAIVIINLLYDPTYGL